MGIPGFAEVPLGGSPGGQPSELSEIESVIGENPAVAHVAVAVRGERLFAYVVLASLDIAGLTREHQQNSRLHFDEEHREGPAAQRANTTVTEHIRALRPQRLLEIGCGAGALLRELLPV